MSTQKKKSMVNQLTSKSPVGLMPLGLSTKFHGLIKFWRVSIDSEQMIIYFLFKTHCTKKIPSRVKRHISPPGY